MPGFFLHLTAVEKNNDKKMDASIFFFIVSFIKAVFAYFVALERS
jgi:hypothetical protein